MSCLRSLPLALLACLSLMFMAPLRRQPTPATAPAPLQPLHDDARADQVLVAAINNLDADHLRWVQSSLWQRVRVPPLCFQVDGKYLSGPDHRLRLEMNIRVDGSERRTVVVSDGRTLWEGEQVDSGNWQIQKGELRRVLQELNGPQTPPAARAEFFRTQFFTGPALLLQDLKQQVTFTRKDIIRWQGTEAILLTGAKPTSAKQAWPDYKPRQCRLVLDAQTSWPYRLEWWGPAPEVSGDVLLVEVEFRRPVLNKPISDREFRLTIGPDGMSDQTAHWTDRLKSRSLAINQGK